MCKQPALDLEKIRPAAENGDAKAQFELGVAYYHSNGVPQDKVEAAKWFQKAAEQGHAKAQFNLARMYDNSEGVPQDKAEAAHWYEKAAEQGHAKAQFNLALMYDNGEGVPQNKKTAVHWYKKAAENGIAAAQNNLGVMYDNGEGVPKNKKAAVYWFERSRHPTAGTEGVSEQSPADRKTLGHWRHKVADSMRGVIWGSIAFHCLCIAVGVITYVLNSDWQSSRVLEQASLLLAIFVFPYINRMVNRLVLTYIDKVTLFIYAFYAICFIAITYWLNIERHDNKWILQSLGALAVFAPFILSLKTVSGAGRNPASYKAFTAILWLSGMIIYCRTAVPFPEYYDAFLACATIFILILSFRAESVRRRIDNEHELLIRLYRKINAIEWIGGHKKDCINAITEIDKFTADDQNDGAAEFVQSLEKASNEAEYECNREKIAELQSDAELIVHSKGQGDNLYERMLTAILALIMVFGLLLFLPPSAQKDMGDSIFFGFILGEYPEYPAGHLIGFFVEMAAMLITAAIAFLWFNMEDLQKDRYAPVLTIAKQNNKFGKITPYKDIAPGETVSEDGNDVYSISYVRRPPPKRAIERAAVRGLSLLIAIMYGVLFWNEWMPANPFAEHWSYAVHYLLPPQPANQWCCP